MQRRLSNGDVFKTYQDNPTDEVYGWNETADGVIVPKSGGWYRTTDPEQAYRLADLNVQWRALERSDAADHALLQQAERAPYGPVR